MLQLLCLCFSLICASFAQKVGDVAVVSDISSEGGRLEIYFNLQWTPFCVSSVNIRAAALSCNQLGFLHASTLGKEKRLRYENGTRYDKLSISSVRCPVGAVHISSCSFSTTKDCAEYAAIKCSNSQMESTRSLVNDKATTYTSATGTIQYNKISLSKLVVAMSLALTAFFLGATVIVVASVIMWKRKRSQLHQESASSPQPVTASTNKWHFCSSGIYPPKYSEIDVA